MMFSKLLTGFGINVVIPLVGAIIFVQLCRRMYEKDLPSPPYLCCFLLILGICGWTMVVLTDHFWKWSSPARAGSFFLLYLAPLFTAKAAMLIRAERSRSLFHQICYGGSIGYSALMAGIIVWLVGLAFFRPWTTYREVRYGNDPSEVMDILVPRGVPQLPTIVLIHGGGFISGDKLDLQDVAKRLVRQGFIVANINYRLATASTNQYPSAVDDAETSVNFLKEHAQTYKVNVNRMAAFGTSAGANLAIELGLSGKVRAVIDFYGPTDFMDPGFLDDFYNGEQNNAVALTYLGATLVDDSPLYYDASPIDMVSLHMPPTLIFHGANDSIVPVAQSVSFHRRLVQLGVVSQIYVEPNLGHGFLTMRDKSPQPYLNQCRKFLQQVMPEENL